jgi:COMPASS component SWD2
MMQQSVPFATSSKRVTLTPALLRSLAPARVLPTRDTCSSLSFSPDGAFLAVASGDDSLSLVDTTRGEVTLTLSSKKHGIDLPRFTHAPKAILCASTAGKDESVRYWSLHDNRWLATFSGHRDRVTAIAMSPTSDSFASASRDGTVRFWDLRDQRCQGCIRTPTSSASGVSASNNNGDVSLGEACAVEYDPAGKVVFVCAACVLYIYDVSKLDLGPFCTAILPESARMIRAMRVSPSGDHMVLVGAEVALLLDAFNGQVLHIMQVFGGSVPSGATAATDASFSPDGRYVTVAFEDGILRSWEISVKADNAFDRCVEVAQHVGHPAGVKACAWSPKHAMLASACSNVALWLPKLDAS